MGVHDIYIKWKIKSENKQSASQIPLQIENQNILWSMDIRIFIQFIDK